jgi:hypothetical protein
MNKWVALAIGICCGGLGGSVFTWYVNHPRSTTVTYSITTTTTGADPMAKALVPDLHLQIGTNEVTALYTHVVSLTTVDGPQLDTLPVAVMFSTPVKFYGYSNEAPSPIHKFSCERIQTGLASVCFWRSSPI